MKPASVAASPAQEDIRLISSPATSRIEFFPHMLALICVLTLAPAAVAGTVTITSPTNGATVASPVHVHATYSGSASYMKLWLDHKASTVQSNTNVFDQQISLSSGAHVITVQALDSSNGLIYADTVNITVGSSGATVTVSPGSATLNTGSTLQFTATDSAGLTVTWSATGGTITSNGLYTAGTTAGTFKVTATDSNNNLGTASVTIQNSTRGSTARRARCS
ncbi:MAG: hypothetical protein DMG93_01905 [Acidobacteria bacterium]|nr:MAG: hypothetical protein DMG93_01905 [Acidobacteriota bacterium]